MQIGLDLTLAKAQEKKKTKRLVLLTVLAFLAIFLFSLCIRTATKGLVAPSEAAENIYTWIKLTITRAFSLPGYIEAQQAIQNDLPFYFETVQRVKVTFLTLLAGGMLAIAGMIYQGVFRNPIAAPTMLGVATGVDLGVLVMVLLFGGAAYNETLTRYQLCYLFALIILAFVMFAAKLIAGKKRRVSVSDMLLIGIVLSQILGVVTGVATFEMEAEELVAYNELLSGIYINTDGISFMFLGISFLIGMIPIFLFRYSFNAICFSDEDAYSLGINPNIVRYTTLLCATLLIVSAMVHVGGIGMISLIVPHFCRYLFGVDSRKLIWASFVFGGLLLLVCRAISAAVNFGVYGELPIGNVVSFIAAPAFLIILLKQRRGWE